MTLTDTSPEGQNEPGNCCDGCALGRRAFLRNATLAALGMAVAIAEKGAATESLPIGFVRGRRDGRTEKAYPVPSADGVTIDRDDDVILVRHAGHVYAFGLACPHQNTALRWVTDEGGRFECPKHHSKYQPDGTFISGRATRSMDRFAIRHQGNEIFVDLDRLYEQDKQQAEWGAALVALS
jgi:nitrite reductase/ring-hydroxylating ferredoxin subunit